MYRKHGNNRFQCPYCVNKWYTQRGDCKKHVLNHHNDEQLPAKNDIKKWAQLLPPVNYNNNNLLEKAATTSTPQKSINGIDGSDDGNDSDDSNGGTSMKCPSRAKQRDRKKRKQKKNRNCAIVVQHVQERKRTKKTQEKTKQGLNNNLNKLDTSKMQLYFANNTVKNQEKSGKVTGGTTINDGIEIRKQKVE